MTDKTLAFVINIE